MALISESKQAYFCPYYLKSAGGNLTGILIFLRSCTQHLESFHPFHPYRCHASRVFKCLRVRVCVSEEVCCGWLNGHSRRWQAPWLAIAGLEHTPSGKPLLYQPTAAWLGHRHLLISFLWLSASLSLFIFLCQGVDPLTFLTNFRCPGSVMKGLFV